MATGDMPPGGKGNLFVHDPKVGCLRILAHDNNISTCPIIQRGTFHMQQVIYKQKPMYMYLNHEL